MIQYYSMTKMKGFCMILFYFSDVMEIKSIFIL